MEIHFCDLCNESVPQTDLDQGLAFIRRGRVVCAKCDRAMTHAEGADPHGETSMGSPLEAESSTSAREPATLAASATLDTAAREAASLFSPAAPLHSPTAPVLSPAAQALLPEVPGLSPAVPGALIPAAPSSTGSSGLVLAMVALIFAAGAVAVLNEQIRTLGEHGRAVELQLRNQNGALRDLERSNADARGAVAALEGQVGERLANERERAEKALADLRAEAERLQKEQRDLLQGIDEVREGTLAKGQDIDRRSDDLSHRLAKSEDDSRVLLERIAKLEEQAQQAPPPSAGPGAPAASRWTALVNQLQSPKAATRWEAVDQIGQSKDPEAVPYLLPMLKDADVFVRMATARVLGDLQAAGAVPALIDALEDSEAAVREAALGSLRAVTGKDLRFDPLASEGERAKKVKAWREWWKKMEEEGGLGQGKGQG
jgi:chaperonin cofactor prefoldin